MAMASSSGLSSDLAGGADTIVARATPAGRGALAVIRISGLGARDVAKALCPGMTFDAGWQATLTMLHDATGEALDRGIVIPFPAARSYTGEDMFEATVHGSPYLVESVIEACVGAGARRARPGEFTRRAVANGKLDLVQAEAIRDLVAAETAWQLRNAREQLSGLLSAVFAGLRHEMVTLLATLEASLDYEGQGVDVGEDQIAVRIAACRDTVARLVSTAGAGQRIRDGVGVVILGRPNAGKSTLFNRLCGTARAIVSPHPGTTRDVIEAELDIGGVRMVLRDTAGLRERGDAVETEGHRRAVGAAAEADIVILMWASDTAMNDEPPEVPRGVTVIPVRSKADLGEGGNLDAGWLPVSCHTGEGMDALRARLVATVAGEIPSLGGAVAIAARHRESLERAADELAGCEPTDPEIGAERVRRAVIAVDELIGEVSSEEVLDAIYDDFCIGK
jgi:tRNA modification GTPase